MATTTSLAPLCLTHRRLLSPNPGTASRFQTLTSKKAASSTIPGLYGGAGSELLSMLDGVLTDEEYRRGRPGASQGRGGGGVRHRGDLGGRAQDLCHCSVLQHHIQHRPPAHSLPCAKTTSSSPTPISTTSRVLSRLSRHHLRPKSELKHTLIPKDADEYYELRRDLKVANIVAYLNIENSSLEHSELIALENC